jgi:hypothetical protein
MRYPLPKKMKAHHELHKFQLAFNMHCQPNDLQLVQVQIKLFPMHGGILSLLFLHVDYWNSSNNSSRTPTPQTPHDVHT